MKRRTIADPTAAGRVVRYAVLPGIIPRARVLFNLRFHGLAFALACIFQTMRLLPSTHPYFNPANYGRYGVLQVMAAGASRLVLSRKNIDQIIVFFALIAGLVIMALQIVAMLVAFTLPAAQADDVVPEEEIVVTSPGRPCDRSALSFYEQCPADKANDVALLLMDRVFGIPKFFGSCLNKEVARPEGEGGGFCIDRNREQESIPWPFHEALHSIFEFYSYALLTVGVIILLYFIFVIVAETAETGTPFGKRFNSLWAPLRIVVAFGLLIPFGAYGLNGAQHLVLYAAKFGSAMASNGWYLFMDRMLAENATLGAGPGTEMTGRVHPPSMEPLVDFFATVHFCKHATELTAKYAGTNEYMDVAAYLYKNGDTPIKLLPTTFAEALAAFNGQAISIAFGVDMTGKPQASRFRGRIMPVCGVINIPATVGGFKNNDDGEVDYNQPENLAAWNAQRIYYNLVSTLWKGGGNALRARNGVGEGEDTRISELAPTATAIDQHAAWWFGLHLPIITDRGCEGVAPVAGCSEFLRGARSGHPNPTEHLPTFATDERSKWINSINDYLWNCGHSSPSGACSRPVSGGAIFDTANDNSEGEGDYNELQACLDQVEEVSFKDLGWGGAGAFYNCIASSNGTYVGAVLNGPTVVSRPALMELIRAQRARGETGASATEMFCPEQGGEAPAALNAQDQEMASVYCALSRLFTQNMQSSGGNIFIDMIHFLFGTSGLDTLRNNPNTHPLAALTVLGRGVIDSVITKIGVGLAGMAGQIFLGGAGEIGGVISGFMFSLAGIGLTAGFILYYVVPFMPFMYFFFALGIWAKTIFEAMVGVPLWALAHIRIDGQGLPGDAAQNGYHLLLEIFIRPILIVFGLLASVTIFSAMALTLNDIFDTVTGLQLNRNPATPGAPAIDEGLVANARSAVDEFFFLILYTIIIYLMAVSSFKLIDMVPQSILRWMGSGAQAFGDQASAQVDQMTGYIAIGGSTIFPQVTQGVQGLGQGLSSVAQGMMPRTP